MITYEPPKRLLLSYLTGVGNSLMCIPTLRTLCHHLPDTEIDVLVRHAASQDILERVHSNGTIFVLNPKNRSWMHIVRFLRMLRKRQYDVNLTVFPSNRAELNILSRLIGAKRRVAHRYHNGYFQTLSFLHNDHIPAVPHRHEIEQNLSLLSALHIPVSQAASRDTGFPLKEQERACALDFLNAHHIGPQDVIIGFHPGCNPAQGNLYRRWPTAHYAALGDHLADTFGAQILVGFGGKDENPLAEDIAARMSHRALIPDNTSLAKTAALIRHCRLFVASDSGLMHVAVAMHVPTVALFGPIPPERDAPHGSQHLVIQSELPCVPCNTYPQQPGGSYIRCIYPEGEKGMCLRTISVERVYHSILKQYSGLLRHPLSSHS